jgi:hypothetical protein
MAKELRPWALWLRDQLGGDDVAGSLSRCLPIRRRGQARVSGMVGPGTPLSIVDGSDEVPEAVEVDGDVVHHKPRSCLQAWARSTVTAWLLTSTAVARSGAWFGRVTQWFMRSSDASGSPRVEAYVRLLTDEYPPSSLE